VVEGVAGEPRQDVGGDLGVGATSETGDLISGQTSGT